METFQQTFASTIANLIYQAYTSGVLQFHPMTIANITIELTIFSHFNQLAFRFNNRLLSISIYDEDSEDAQLSSIQNLLADLIA